MLDDDEPPEAAESPGGGAPDDIVFDLGLTGELGKSSETLEETVAASAGLDLDTKSIHKRRKLILICPTLQQEQLFV